MSLSDLLPQNQGKEKGKAKKPKVSRENDGPGRPATRVNQISFTLRTEAQTKELLLKIQKIKELTQPDKVSQGDVVKEALELLAKKMKLEEKEKEFAKFLSNIK